MTGISGNMVLKALVLATALFLVPALTHAKRIENPVAVFTGIDKITGRTTTFDVYIDETVQFGALQVTPRVCYTRDDEEAAKTTTLLKSMKSHSTARSAVCSRVGCLPILRD